MHFFKEFLTAAGNYRKKAMKDTPDDKGIICAMPNSACQIDDHNMQIRAHISFAIAAQRNVNIFCKKTCQRFMPAVPEFSNGEGFIGRVKIDRQINIHHLPDANGHIAIAAEIKINLNGVGQTGKEGIGGV